MEDDVRNFNGGSETATEDVAVPDGNHVDDAHENGMPYGGSGSGCGGACDAVPRCSTASRRVSTRRIIVVRASMEACTVVAEIKVTAGVDVGVENGKEMPLVVESNVSEDMVWDESTS